MNIKREQEPVTSTYSGVEKQWTQSGGLYGLVQYAVSRVLLEAATLDDAAERLLQAIGEGMLWELGALWIIDQHQPILRCHTTWQASSISAPRFEHASQQMSFPPGLGLPGRVWASGEPAWISDVLEDSNFPRLSIASSEGLHAAFAFPIHGGSGILGVIEFFSSEIRSPDEDLVRTVITIGNQIGQFFEKGRAEEAVRASDARKGAILQTALDAIITIDLQGKIVEFNPAAEHMFGYHREAVLGQEMAQLIIPPSLRAQHYQGFAHYLATGQGPLINQRVEITALRADGSEFPVELAVTRVPLDGLPLFTGYIRDIAERKQVEEERTKLLVREQEVRAEAEAATKRLAALQAVTDTVLAHLALNDLLHELLTRIHEIMAVDNVAILLTSEDNRYLIMRAAFGPEEEVAAQVRVPFGQGFAGTIAARSKPLIVEDLSTVEIMTPILREKLRSLLGVPLVIEGRVIGVMHIGTMSSRRFTEDDVQLLQRVADRVALAIAQSRLYEAEQRARNEATARANELEVNFRSTRDSLNALLAMAEALVLVPDEADPTDEYTSPEVTEVARRLAELICSVLGCKRVAITAVEPETKQLRAVAAVGISQEQEQKWRTRQPDFVLGNMFVDPAYSARLQADEVLVLDMTQPPFRDYPNPYGIRVMLLAPMSIGDQLVGFMAVDHAGAEHEYTSDEKAMASAVAKLAALVLERARLLHERAEARATELALRDANRRMDEFLGIASHELRTPLTTIKANIQLAGRQLKKLVSSASIHTAQATQSPGSRSVPQMASDAGASSKEVWGTRSAGLRLPEEHSEGVQGEEMRDGAELARQVEVIQGLIGRADQQSEVLNRLVGDLLNVSRIQANRLELHLRPEPCNLVTIVQQAVQDQCKVTPKRTILLEISTEKTVPVIADPDRIGQAVMNYLANALKYSSPDRPVDVSLRVEGPVARVSVHDQGPGLSAREQERIWERFYRAPGVEVKSGSGVGLGLGLYISKIIIERHHGQVGVQSAPGKGSTFWFIMPLVDTSSIETE